MAAAVPSSVCNGRFSIGDMIGKGSFGTVYRGHDELRKNTVAVKIQHDMRQSSAKTFEDEAKVYRIMGSSKFTCNLYWHGDDNECKVTVMDLLTVSLMDFWKHFEDRIAICTLVILGEQMLSSLEFVHSKRITHNDIKPDNFMFSSAGQLLLIDFGLSTPYWMPKQNQHQSHAKRRGGILGSARYASINSHGGFTLSRKDDLISFIYVLVHLITGTLPWLLKKHHKGLSRDEKFEMIRQTKIQTSVSTLGENMPGALHNVLHVVFNLEFQEAPDYDLLRRYLTFARQADHSDGKAEDITLLVQSVSDQTTYSSDDAEDALANLPVSELKAIGGIPVDPAERIGALSAASSGASYGEIVRDYQPSLGVEWRYGRPNYAIVNKAYFSNRSKRHEEGSLEQLVTRMVKNWEVESHHIADINNWKTMDAAMFKGSVNGRCPMSASHMAEVGPYNMMLGDTHGYVASGQTFESANKIFNKTFLDGFAFEVLEAYSGPPRVTFKWRHFGKFSGTFVDTAGVKYKGSGNLVELFGICVLSLTDTNLIRGMEVYFDRSELLAPLMACPYSIAIDDPSQYLSCIYESLCSATIVASPGDE